MKLTICGVYKITSPSGKIYIGQSINIYKRWTGNYYCLKCKAQPYLYNSLKKYGYRKHKFEIICQCSPSELNGLEKYYVDLFQTFNSAHGLNLKDGGGSRGKFSEESKRKMSIAMKGRVSWNKGRKVFSEEAKRKIGERSKGNKYRLGHTFSDESKHKIRIARLRQISPMLGKRHSEETKNKIRAKRALQIISEETKIKIGNSQRGKKKPRKVA